MCSPKEHRAPSSQGHNSNPTHSENPTARIKGSERGGGPAPTAAGLGSPLFGAIHLLFLLAFVRWVSLRVVAGDSFSSDGGSSCCKAPSQQQQVPCENEMEEGEKIKETPRPEKNAALSLPPATEDERGVGILDPPLSLGRPHGWCPRRRGT